MARWSPQAAPVTRGCSVSFAIGFPSSRDRAQQSASHPKRCGCGAFSPAGESRFAIVADRDSKGRKLMPEQTQPRQLLHLVFGGELTDLESVEFRDLGKLDITGIYPNYAAAYAAWKAKAQQTVDNAHMRYFIVHLHRLLDPQTDRAAKR
jgi:hypothetical protein